MDITTLTVPQLKELLAQIPGEIKRREKEEKVRIRKELEALASQHGYSLNELLDQAEGKKVSRGSVAPKYRSPADASLTWSGRGRQPKWVQECLASGSTLESLAI